MSMYVREMTELLPFDVIYKRRVRCVNEKSPPDEGS